MDICQHRVRKVIIDDQINVSEIDSSGDNICCDKNPEFPLIELSDNLLSLFFWFITWQDLNSFTFMKLFFHVFFQLIVQLFSSSFLLNKDQNWRDQLSFSDQIFQIDQFA